MSPAPRDALPQAVVVGPYRLLEVLGEGGMGVVHLGMDAHDRVAAVKLLRPTIALDTEARARFAREAAVLQRLRHPRVAEVVDIDLTGPTPYVAMRYVPGPPLDQVVAERGPLTGAALAGILWGLVDGVSVIHAAGLVHRDIKPSNVLVLDGEPVIVDFGVARGEEDVTLTAAGLVVGTPGYLAPEVLAGAAPDRAVDWWGWAAVAAFTATARPPFGRGPVELVYDQVRRGDPDLDGVPAGLASLLRATLHPQPSARPTPEELRAGLAAAVGSPPSLPPMSVPMGGRPVTEHHPPFPPGGAGVAVPSVRPVPAGTRVVGQPVVRSQPRHPKPPAPAVQPVQQAHPGPSRAPVARPVPAVPATRVARIPSFEPAQPVAVPLAPAGAGPLVLLHPSSGWLQWPWLVAVVSVAVLAPIETFWLGVLWVTTMRAVAWTVVGRARRRWAEASGTATPTGLAGGLAGAVVAFPLRWGGALLVTLAYALPLLGVAALLVWLRQVVPGFLDTVSTTRFALVASVVGVVLTWWGPGGTTVRRGTRAATYPIVRSARWRWVWLALAVVVLVTAALSVSARGAGPAWTPAYEAPAWLSSWG